MMRASTMAKVQNFYKAHPVGSRVVSLQCHDLDTSKYPCWSTLKRNGIVEQESTETVTYEYTDGITVDVLYNVYRVK